MSTLLQDLRYATRSLMKTPALTLAAVLSLGLGIGANTTVFTWVQAVILRPIPGAANADSLWVLSMESREGSPRSFSYPNYRDFRDRAKTVSVIGQDDLSASVAVEGQAERALGALVDGSYFQEMGVQPALGRLFTASDDRTPGGHPVAVLSHAYWLRRFGGDPQIVGRQITVNNTPMTVIGVAEQGFLGAFLGISTAVWVPMAMQAQMTGTNRLELRGQSWMQAYVRLKDGVSREQAQAEMSTIMTQLAREYPEANEGNRVRVVRTWEARFGAPQVLAPILAVLSVVVALVLLIACANVANLLLSRAVGRRREIAIRLSLGANRVRLLRQLLTEAVVLSLLAGAVGVAMAYWTSGVLMAFAPPTDMPIDFGLRVDATTLGYCAAVSLLTGLFFGLAPAWQASNPSTVNAMKEDGLRGTGGRTGHRLRGALVVAQVAVCLVLLIGAALFVRSLQEAQHVEVGFDPRGLVITSIDLVPNGYNADTGRQFQRRLVESVRGVPGVQSLALGRYVPISLGGSSSMGVDVDGYSPAPNEEMVINYNIVGPNYFETMKIPLVTGREFDDQDSVDAPRAAIINETMAKRYWPNREAVGGRFKNGKTEYRVVGVARDIKYYLIAERPQPHLYLALGQVFSSGTVLHVRSAGDPTAVLAGIRAAVRSLDPNLPVFDGRTMTEHMKTGTFAQEMGANLLGAMGVLALLLASVGLYGVVAYAVSQRTQEMGIRLALGAQPSDLLRMVVRQGLTLTAIGLAIGLVIAFAVTGFMTSLLPGVTPRDPITFVSVPLMLTAIALFAAWIPARRAGAVDPVVALRYE